MIDSILRYLDTEHPDYAVMIDGPWGSGKTYWVRNTVIPEAAKRRYRPIYVSAASATSPTALEKTIFVARFMRRNEAKEIDPGLLEAALSVGQAVPAGAVATRLLAIISRSAGKAVARGLSFDKTLIVIDDLERVHHDITAHDLLGHMFQRFVDSGHAHMLVVGNLQKLNDGRDNGSAGQFNDVREKYIRLVVPFRPSRKEQVQDLIAPIKVLAVRNAAEQAINDFADVYRDFNLRTVQYVVSQLQHLETVLDEYATQLSVGDIVTTMMVFATELAGGHVPPTDSDALFALTYVEERESIRRRIEENAGLESETRTIGAELGQRYSEMILRRLVPLRFLTDLLSGHAYCDERARSEIDHHLRRGKTPVRKAFDDLASYYTHEFDELNDIASRVLAYAEDGKYEAERYPYITSLFDLLNREQFLNKLPCDWLERLHHGVEKSIEGRPDFPFATTGITDSVTASIYDNTRPPPRSVTEMQELVVAKLRHAAGKHAADSVLSFFLELQTIPETERGLRYREIRHAIDFSTIDSERFAEIVAGMNNCGLYWVRIILDDLFEQSTQRAAINVEQSVLSNVVVLLKHCWDNETNVDPLRQFQRNVLITKLKECATHLAVVPEGREDR